MKCLEKRGFVVEAIIVFIVVIIILLLLDHSVVWIKSCNDYLYKVDPIESGDFLYITESYNKNGKQVSKFNKKPYKTVAKIVGLSESGKQKEIIIVPKEIDGIEIVQIGKHTFGAMCEESVDGIWTESSLDRAYVLGSSIIYDVTYKKVMLVDTEISDWTSENMWLIEKTSQVIEKVYVASCFRTDGAVGSESEYPYSYCANVSYMYNYDDAPNNGYFWIDDYDYGSIIKYVPENPTRENYTFGGWYKEAECINEWNFELDELPDAESNNGTIIYQETILYAKWIEE